MFSFRIRHHTLNEQLKVICQQVPGSGDNNRETKVRTIWLEEKKQYKM
jgi:hypothetical protein